MRAIITLMVLQCSIVPEVDTIKIREVGITYLSTKNLINANANFSECSSS
jgi:hypothetical protein